ncbi:hypothetical protein [Gordoniibacillus kamchatkensis]|uniref:hypothetical protein n=1 Tax=Gordoniibacillus kamchatkensis TaxID=1590651 RepID=UPI000AE86365|nr:hypothetical protein [Paenibacillus sp. VKM B-2647]
MPYILGKNAWEHGDIEETKPDPGFARYLAMSGPHDTEINVKEVMDRLLQNQNGKSA